MTHPPSDTASIQAEWYTGQGGSTSEHARQTALAQRAKDIQKTTIREQAVQAAIYGFRLAEQITAVEVAGVPATIGVSTGVEVEATGMMLESCGFDRYGALYEARA